MKNENRMREWATPVTIGAFALSAVTGIMLFFKVNLGLVKHVHEWLSWLLVVGTVFHLTVNWRSCVRYASKPLGRLILIAFFLLICASLLPMGKRHDGRQFGRISDVLMQNPLWAVAQAADHSPDEAMNILKSKGIHVEGKDQTIRDIATKNDKSTVGILEIIF
ncbi:MAG: hypothetical protein A4E58_02411 [Syntrophorhabdus sp. PtaB.Bin006]|nr:MAG: hypothetical protein A4E58_02411 [Syntrophorhabdus sp. PtaB.Bin006]